MQTYLVNTIEDATELQDIYETHWWFQGRTVHDIRRSLDGSDEVFGLRTTEDDTLVASCRVITDYTYTGKILDVIVTESVRRQGLGSKLIAAVTDHPSLERVEELTLNCREGIAPFYEQLGFDVHDMIERSPTGTSEDYYVMLYT